MGRVAVLPALAGVLLGERPPHLVDDACRLAGDLAGRPLEVLRPQAEPGRARERLVLDDDVHLRVVEERVLVEVRRAEGEPAVVDDADLRVHVDRPPGGAGLVQRGGDEAGGAVAPAALRVDEDAELPPGVVGAVVRVRRQQHDQPEVLVRRLP